METFAAVDDEYLATAISRAKSRLSWGIELPFDKDYICYVWVDALFNYETAVGYLTDDARHAKWWPADLQDRKSTRLNSSHRL